MFCRNSISKIFYAGVTIATLLWGAGASQADTQTIRFYGSIGDLKPFYWREDGRLHGIIPDIFAEIPDIDITLASAPHKRIDAFFLERRIDAAMLHPQYTKADTHLTFVPLLFNQENVLFAHQSTKQTAKKIEDLTDTSICTRFGYRYVNLDNRWDSQNLKRENLKTNDQVLKMLTLNRCDYAIGSKISFSYLLQSRNLPNIYLTDITVNSLPRYIAMSNKLGDLPGKLEAALRRLKDSGKLDSIINKYTARQDY